MNRYQTYATSGGVIDCSTMDIDVGDDPSLAEQPCRLALAKGKDAVIRVGGGENWGEVFSAVRKANDEQPGGYKYHAVGGAAATVSPMVRYLGSMQFIKCVDPQHSYHWALIFTVTHTIYFVFLLTQGWTFSGGLAGTVAGRTYGFGVDQGEILIELVSVLYNVVIDSNHCSK